MDVEFNMYTLEEALETYGCPGIMSTDQGSQYPSERFLQSFKDRDILVRIDSKRRVAGQYFCRTAVAVSQV